MFLSIEENTSQATYIAPWTDLKFGTHQSVGKQKFVNRNKCKPEGCNALLLVDTRGN